MNSVTIMFKEFGIRLSFTPTVLGGDLINLKVKPEVSSLDFGNAVTVSGFRIPALTTRRTETEVELRDGQTFAIAGLLANTVQDSMRKIPGIGDIPILGWLFKSRAMQKAQTELVVMITPTIIRRGQSGVSEGLPSLVEPFLDAPAKTHPVPDAYVGSPRYPVTQPARPAGTDAANTPAAPVAPAPAVQPSREATAVAPPAAVAPSAPAAVPPPAPAPLPSSPLPAASGEAPSAPLTKEQLKAIEEAREEERKASAAAEKERIAQEKRDAEQQKVAAREAEKRAAVEAKLAAEQARKDDVARRRAEKLEKERAAKEAIETQAREKREAEDARRKAQEQEQREKALSDAAARLKQAQAEYQSQVEKAQAGPDATKATGAATGSYAPRR